MAKRSREREQFLADVITTAVEGGTGYWAAVSDYHWSDEEPATTRATLHEVADDDYEGDTLDGDRGRSPWVTPYKARGVQLTVDNVARAIVCIVAGGAAAGREPLGPGYVKAIAAASAVNDGGDIDADLADVIAQVAVLGAVIYG